jgi:hypothetical protein
MLSYIIDLHRMYGLCVPTYVYTMENCKHLHLD